MKAVAVHAVFIIAVILIFIFFLAAIFFEWIDITELVSDEAACRMKLLNYCSDWVKTGKEPFDWNKKEPLNCGDITQPSEPQCEEMFK